MLIADDTLRYEAMRALKHQLGVGLIISSLLLLVIAFMSALKVSRRLVNVTLVAKEHNLAKAQGSRTHIDIREESLLFHDEISEASHWLSNVSDKVERLSEGEHNTSQRIESIAKALRVEKERVAHLVGNSGSVMVTQGLDGGVLTVNDVGKKLFGISGKNYSRAFSDLFFAGELNQEARESINRLYMGLDNIVCSNSHSLDLHGQLRDFTWIHSFIDECSTHRPVILSIGMDMTIKRKAEKRLALYDSLTAVANEQFFLDKLPELMEDSLKNGSLLSVLCCGIVQLRDNLPLFDLSGRDAALSAAIIGRISSCLRGDDIVVRFGNELFIVVIKGLKTRMNGGDKARKIIQTFADPFFIEGVESVVGVNIGISVFPDQAVGVTEIVSNAEVAMFLSKKLGSNNYQYYGQEESASKDA